MYFISLVSSQSYVAGLRLKIISLNINGINENIKQIKLVSFLQENAIDIAMIQEHNVKDLKKIEYLNQFYHIILNKSILLKGGTLIAINRKLPSTIGLTYLHPTSRLSTAFLNIFDKTLYPVNVYAPSGKNKEKEREDFFEQELMLAWTAFM